ncbi:MAG: phosphate acyltransferase PlsX [Planctomycetes bacterium]|nr:phosphate acyltransferase PlsX [Planctomycetota bacterium]
MQRIALDAMGGDHAPREIVLGALQGLRKDPELAVVLVGREAEIEAELAAAEIEIDRTRLSVIHAEDVVGCNESPVEALRKKRDNSIVKCFAAVLEGKADAVVSAGSTGAVVGAAHLLWKLIPGVRRAGIAVALGSKKANSVLVDVGANIHCKPIHLLHYGMMAAIFAEGVLGHANPRVALLNIGTEEGKGNDLVKETRRLFEESPLNYIGHVEGNDIFAHKADVIVCEGFVGNVVLKVSEGLAERMHERFEQIVGVHVDPEKHPTVAQHIAEFRRATDYAEVGGAALLGVNGTCLIAHGRSDRRAIGNAVTLAARFVRAGVRGKIESGLGELQASS